MSKFSDFVETEQIGCVRRIGLNRPPVNALNLSLRRAIVEAILAANADTGVGAIVLHSVGRGFSAGGDIAEFGTSDAAAEPGLSSVLQPTIEQCSKPVVAAMHGFALGGGLEIALACHYRVAVKNTRIGLPEVGLGIIPLSATQRLPRLVGVEAAVEMILSARVAPVLEWNADGLMDLVVDETDPVSFVATARSYASSLPDVPPASVLARNRHLPGSALATDSALLIRLAKIKSASAGDQARLCALRAIAEGTANPDFDEGMRLAARLYAELSSSEEARKLRAGFLSA